MTYNKRATRQREYALEQKQKLDETITEEFRTRWQDIYEMSPDEFEELCLRLVGHRERPRAWAWDPNVPIPRGCYLSRNNLDFVYALLDMVRGEEGSGLSKHDCQHFADLVDKHKQAMRETYVVTRDEDGNLIRVSAIGGVRSDEQWFAMVSDPPETLPKRRRKR